MIARKIVENLEAAFEQFRLLADDLNDKQAGPPEKPPPPLVTTAGAVQLHWANLRVRAVTLQEIMTSKIVTVEMDDRLEVVKQIFDSTKFHHLLVVEDGTLLGIVSDRDLLRALSPYIGSTVETARDTATLNKRVHQIMTRKPITLRPEAEIGEAVTLLLDHRISCIPVVDQQFRPVGIVSWRDVLRAIAGR